MSKNILYPRKIQEEINKWLFKDEIIILNGPRQVGKTSLLKLLQDELKREKIKEEQIFYLDLEDFEILNDLNSSPKNILNYIKTGTSSRLSPRRSLSTEDCDGQTRDSLQFLPVRQAGSTERLQRGRSEKVLKTKNKKSYFLIDEIQYLDNPSNFLKYLYDEHRDEIKLIVSGSSSLELKAKLQDALVGRKISFAIAPLCFEEFLKFKQAEVLDYYCHKNIPLPIQIKFKKLLDEYLLFGGMPKVVLTENDEAKKTLLKNYVGDYINKDIRSIGKVSNLLKFNQLVKILANQISNLLNINELSNTLDIPRQEIENYLNLLEYTYVLNRTAPYYKNLRSQITKMPKIYLFDLGIRNQILNNFIGIDNRSDNGNLFENFVYLELKINISQENIYFYRTIHKAEIDFIFEKNGVVYPLEVKYKNFNKPAGSRVLSNFCNIKNINCPNSYLINLNLNQKDKKINFLDFVNFFEKLGC